MRLKDIKTLAARVWTTCDPGLADELRREEGRFLRPDVYAAVRLCRSHGLEGGIHFWTSAGAWADVQTIDAARAAYRRHTRTSAVFAAGAELTLVHTTERQRASWCITTQAMYAHVVYRVRRPQGVALRAEFDVVPGGVCRRVRVVVGEGATAHVAHEDWLRAAMDEAFGLDLGPKPLTSDPDERRRMLAEEARSATV